VSLLFQNGADLEAVDDQGQVCAFYSCESYGATNIIFDMIECVSCSCCTWSCFSCIDFVKAHGRYAIFGERWQ